MFEAPATSSGVKPADLNGHLLLIKPTEWREKVQTSMGESDAIAVDIVDLDTNEEHTNTLFFNSALRNSLRPMMGKQVLARMGQGAAKPGKNAPWILLDATQDAAAVAKANAYLASGLQAPAPQAAPAPTAAAAPAGVDLNDPTIQLLMQQLGAQKA